MTDKQRKSWRWLLLYITILILGLTGLGLVDTLLPVPRHSDSPTQHAADNELGEGLQQPEAGWWEENRKIYFGIPTRILFHVPGQNRNRASEIAGKAWAEFDRIGAIFNSFRASSFVGKLNRSHKVEPVEVPPDMLRLMRIAQRVFMLSDGAFDITSWPIKKEWDMARRKQRPPTAESLARAVARTGFDKIRLPDGDGKTLVFARPDIELDFGGIVKGYVVELVRGILLKEGVQAGLIQCGGEIVTFGSKDGRPWQIGVQDPLDMNKMWGVIAGSGTMRVSTSGNYRQPLLIAGKSYYHIFNPKDGQPVSEEILSVTVASFQEDENDALVDATATAITVMGRERGLALATQLNLEVVIVYRAENGAIAEVMSKGMAEHYRRREH